MRIGIFVVLALACESLCQSVRPAFEAASIKPSDGRGGIDIQTSAKRFWSTCSVRQLIVAAYNVERWQLTAGPAWLDSDLFSIEATTGEDLSADPDRVIVAGRPAPRRMTLMLQALLAERFNLRVHRETREDNVFSLVVAKGGAKLRTPQDKTRSRVGTSQGSTAPGAATTITTGQNASLRQPAQYLSNRVHGPVADQTGIAGNYDFSLEYAYDDSATNTGSPFFTALQMPPASN